MRAIACTTESKAMVASSQATAKMAEAVTPKVLRGWRGASAITGRQRSEIVHGGRASGSEQEKAAGGG